MKSFLNCIIVIPYIMLIPVLRRLMCGLMTLICCVLHVFITLNSNNQEAPYTIIPVATCLYWFLVVVKKNNGMSSSTQFVS